MTSVIKTDSQRDSMKSYWNEHSANSPTVEAMMLDQGASSIDKLERPEILGMLPDISGMDMIEMGAGIGRLTGDLAARAKSVLACDFVEASCKVNEETHGSLGNVEVLCADATKLVQPAESLDLVFSNWLLMYLTDDEVCQLFSKALIWLRPGGYLFFRESCFHKSGNTKRTDNPTVYRTPAQYHSFVTQQISPERDGSGLKANFELVSQKTVKTYVDLKDNHNQVAWLYQKTKSEPRNAMQGMALQTFLDTQRYTTEVICAYERIYGEGFISVGGLKTSSELIALLELQESEKVLDVGCAIGGGWQKKAYEYGVNVLGVDLSVNMVNVAMERRIPAERQLVAFEVADVMERQYEDASFDVIYSRDAILHIEDKAKLFARLLAWLKPGGRLLITDYCCGDQPHSPDFVANTKRRGYHLVTPAAYGELVKQAGFKTVSMKDKTDELSDIMEQELEDFQESTAKAQFILDFSKPDYYNMLEGWNAKLKWAASGQFKWALISAVKPTLGDIAAQVAKDVAQSLVDCSRVHVKPDIWGGAGAFASVAIKKGELVERGIVRRLTNCDGHENPYVFTWSNVLPNKTWALGSGCSTFYNTCANEEAGNTHMERYFEEDRFVILATKDIAQGDELLHVYKSKKWRKCFGEMPGNDEASPEPQDVEA